MADLTARAICAGCGAELPPALLSCPACRRLVHSEDLKRLAGEADAAEARGAPSDALAALRRAQELLPPGTRQQELLHQRIVRLSAALDAPRPAGSAAAPATGNEGARPEGARRGLLASIGAAILLIVTKFKFLLVLAATKGKLLLAGLTNAQTFFSMLLSMGAYWTIWGWRFGVGAVLSIYVHEMGHVAALRRYGIRATAPMFIPGVGALIRLKQYPATAHEEAIVGLAGPIWGAATAIVALVSYLAGGWELAAALAHFGAFVNLFNLMPILSLDGSHAFRALSRLERGAVTAVLFAAWAYSHEGMLLLIAIVAAVRIVTPATGQDRGITLRFIALVIVLTAIDEYVGRVLPRV